MNNQEYYQKKREKKIGTAALCDERHQTEKQRTR